MVYVVISLVAIWALWAASEWYTDKKIDAIARRLEALESAEARRRLLDRPRHSVIVEVKEDDEN